MELNGVDYLAVIASLHRLESWWREPHGGIAGDIVWHSLFAIEVEGVTIGL